MSQYLELDTKVIKYVNINGDTKQVIITPVGYFNTVKGLKYLKARVPFKALMNEFFKGGKEEEEEKEDFDIEVLMDFLFEANDHLGEASKYFFKEETFDITQVRDIEDLIEILKAVFVVNKIGDAIKNLMGSQNKTKK